jgi:outer membrane protein assembly factor BamB
VRRGEAITDLEQFVTLDADGDRVTARDRNFWGITFDRDGRTFYATVAYNGETHLVRGDVRTRRARIIHDNVECPSLSPDGTRIGYKKLVSAGAGSPKIWRFTVLDLATMRETELAEPAPRDDQLEWLDDDHVLYANGEEIWTVPADGSGAPERYLAAADSPAVVVR